MTLIAIAQIHDLFNKSRSLTKIIQPVKVSPEGCAAVTCIDFYGRIESRYDDVEYRLGHAHPVLAKYEANKCKDSKAQQ